MDVLSVVLLGLVATWFVWALRKVFIGGTCGCGTGKKNTRGRCRGCSGCPVGCEQRKPTPNTQPGGPVQAHGSHESRRCHRN